MFAARATELVVKEGSAALARIEVEGSRRQRQLHTVTRFRSRFDIYEDIKSRASSAVEKAQRSKRWGWRGRQ